VKCFYLWSERYFSKGMIRAYKYSQGFTDMIKLNLAVLARSEMDLGFRGRLKMSLDLRGQV